MSHERGVVTPEDAIVFPPDGVATAGAPSLTDNSQQTPRRQFRPGRFTSAFLGVSATVAAFGSGCADSSTRTVGTEFPDQPTPVSATKTPEGVQTPTRSRLVKQGPDCEIIVNDSLSRLIGGLNYWELLSTGGVEGKLYEECTEFDNGRRSGLRKVSVDGILQVAYLVQTDAKTGIRKEIRDPEELFQEVQPQSDDEILAFLLAVNESFRAKSGGVPATVDGTDESALVKFVNISQVDEPACDPRTSTDITVMINLDPQFVKATGESRIVETGRGTPVGIDEGQCDIKSQ